MTRRQRTKHLRACRRKKKYPCRQAAQARANQLWPDVKLRPCQCPICDGWHLTRIKGKVRTKMAFRELEGLNQ